MPFRIGVDLRSIYKARCKRAYDEIEEGRTLYPRDVVPNSS